MLTLILLLILALGFGYFATQNTIDTSIKLSHSVLGHAPLYVVIGVTLLIGFLFSWIISLVNSLFVALKMRGKDEAIKDTKKTVIELRKKVQELELENARLQGEAKTATSSL